MNSWMPPPPPGEGEPLVNGRDPRVVQTHAPGTPCPANPPPPVGWKYWAGALPDGGTDLAVRMRDDRATFPIGSFAQTWLGGQVVGARVEWHTKLGASGKTGCFRGVNLMRRAQS